MREETVKTVKNTGGNGWVVYDDDVYEALDLLARNGIYASLTAAVGVAGALKAKHKGDIVCIVTDSGLKSNLMLDRFKKSIISAPDDRTLERFIAKLD